MNSKRASMTASTALTLLAAVLPVSAADLTVPSADVPPEWLTLTEQTDFRQTPRHDETVAFCRRLADASPWVTYRSIGTTPEGREMPLLVVSSSGAFDPNSAHEDGKLVVFVQNCIHAAEFGSSPGPSSRPRRNMPW